ncbi:MAG: hypothetical protein A2Z25_24650 [Planctomycetes bacterium RBG_16_55_9]|nr:MAG: hypothetical protein A2Z25_24650 [Planctomycetes bacterium RBG_16_55_9]
MEKERDYIFTYKFIETDAFRTKNRILSESARDDLDFYLMIGRGKLIDDTGGLKIIRCDIGGSRGKDDRDIVFAAYNCPRIRTHLFYLLVKYPVSVIENMSQEQKSELRTLKKKVDKYVHRKYGE